MEDLSDSELPALAARLSWHKGLMEKCTATIHIQSMKWRIPYSLLDSHSGLFQNTCRVFRCMRFFTLSQRGFHPTQYLWPLHDARAISHTQRKGYQLILRGEKAQKALASRLLGLFTFLFLSKSPVCTLAVSCCVFVVEALTLKVPLSPCCCHLAWCPSALGANTSPHRM